MITEIILLSLWYLHLPLLWEFNKDEAMVPLDSEQQWKSVAVRGSNTGLPNPFLIKNSWESVRTTGTRYMIIHYLLLCSKVFNPWPILLFMCSHAWKLLVLRCYVSMDIGDSIVSSLLVTRWPHWPIIPLWIPTIVKDPY